VRCSYCYSCHWKKEKEERRLVEDKISEFFPSPFLRSEKKEPTKKEVQQQLIPEKYHLSYTKKYKRFGTIIDNFFRTTL
jgi:hypothetical protein